MRQMKTSTLMAIRSDCAEIRAIAARLKIVSQEMREVFTHLDRQLADVEPCTDLERAMIELARLKPSGNRADEISGTAAILADLCDHMLTDRAIAETAADMTATIQEAIA